MHTGKQSVWHDYRYSQCSSGVKEVKVFVLLTEHSNHRYWYLLPVSLSEPQRPCLFIGKTLRWTNQFILQHVTSR